LIQIKKEEAKEKNITGISIMYLLNLTIDQNGSIHLFTSIWLTLIILIVISIYIIYISKRHWAKLEKITLDIPFGIGTVDLIPDQSQQKAAWSLYIELVTRIAIQPLNKDEGLIREAMSSLYSLFPTTRQILRDVGPEAGIKENTVGGIAIKVLNVGLRPFLAKWHPLLQEWEAKIPDGVSQKEHEKNWTKEIELRNEIEKLRKELIVYSESLAKIAQIE